MVNIYTLRPYFPVPISHEIGLESNVIDRIATKIAFQARNISDVPPDTVHTDTQTSISLVYDF